MSETKDFVWRWSPGERGWYQPGFSGEQGARLYFWNNSQVNLLPALQKDINEGWTPVTEVGPAAFNLRSFEVTEHTFGFINVVLWFVTFGISFLFDLFSGFGAYKVTRYEPVEFRVVMAK
jgi:hypothetical protein